MYVCCRVVQRLKQSSLYDLSALRIDAVEAIQVLLLSNRGGVVPVGNQAAVLDCEASQLAIGRAPRF
jgi:hypothetical protein